MKYNLFLAFALLFSTLCTLCADERPLLKAGIVSDTHVTPKPASCIWVQKAWELFKKHQVDLVINCGDIADHHYPQGYRHYRNTINALFPDKSKKPKEIYAYANHDRIDVDNVDKAFAAVKKHLEVPHAPYDTLLLNGCYFLIVPQFINFERYEKMIQQAIKAHPGKPIFVIDHIPPFNTTFNTKIWGSRPRRELLSKYPQIVQISGHTHNSLYNELCIWQGEFTAVNAGSLYYWGGGLTASLPEGRKRSTEVLIMEVYKSKIVFRRYSLLDGKEYRPGSPWCVPLPFDPKTAPYTMAKRYANSKMPVFPADGKIAIVTDRKPFNTATLRFPPAVPDVFNYIITLEKECAAGKFEKFTEKEIFSNFHLPEKERVNAIETALPAGYFDADTNYRITVTPVNFYGKKGKKLSLLWKAPAKVQNKVLLESKNPMKELTFMTELTGGVPMKRQGEFYNHDVYNARLLLPDQAWAGIPQGTPLRLTIDIHSIQKPGKNWTLTLRNLHPSRNACGRIYTGTGNIRCRYVIDFKMQVKGFRYALLIREGDPGKIRFNYVKLEQLKAAQGVKK